ncbi:helix-turn-helix domain-containing protein [Cohnella lupini]|uniref:Cro/C1-type helix-turn-helix DNA-binding protein n=1 Tax=Cohnella lupini TaxID=1294267 RepID=A0A3D9I5Y4_9BACL|nr:helix-turn-helix transcriptional regulator [Cohnella lupini]RED57183.1 Cro/C1-type helix-turn-helix DNA-binding protein [Cohnella lupini]
MALTIRIKLEETLERVGITKNALAREAKVRPNLIYEMCEGKTRRIDLDTLSNIIDTINAMTGKKHTIADLLEHNGTS